MLIEVTQEDIDNGVPLQGDRCPVAHAIRRAMKTSWASVGDGEICFSNRTISTPLEVDEFIDSFDNGFHVEPFTFNIKD